MFVRVSRGMVLNWMILWTCRRPHIYFLFFLANYPLTECLTIISISTSVSKSVRNFFSVSKSEYQSLEGSVRLIIYQSKIQSCKIKAIELGTSS